MAQQSTEEGSREEVADEQRVVLAGRDDADLAVVQLRGRHEPADDASRGTEDSSKDAGPLRMPDSFSGGG